MSFPNVIALSYGQEKETSTTHGGIPLGAVGVLPDGRRFRRVQAGASALIAGNMVQGEAPKADWDELDLNTAVAGDKTVTITNGATTAITANVFKDGFLSIEDDTGEGRIYKIKSNPAAATSATCVLTLYEPIAVSLAAATTCLISKSNYAGVVIKATTHTSAVIGCAVSAIPAAGYGWIQTAGPCAVLTDGTVVLDSWVMCSNGTAGAVEAWGLAEAAPPTEIQAPVGTVIEVAATTEHSFINLSLG